MSELFTTEGPFQTGIADIDAEHAQLHIESKRVAAMIAHNEDAEAIHADVLAFIKLLEAHFRHEETHFDKLTPERLEEHMKEHAMMTLSLKLFADSINEREPGDNWKNFIDLEDVLLKHIILFDLDLKF